MTDTFVLGVDLDGVCAEYTLGFRRIVAERLGVSEESLPIERGWDFAEWGFEPGDFEDHHRHAVVDHHMFRNLEAIDGAAETLWRLSDAGIWIRIITHRLYVNWGHEKAVGDTAAWLDQNRIPYRDLCFLGAKPEAEADVYIDDAPHNVEELRRRGNRVIVFDQPYNRHCAGPRARDWSQAESLISDLVTGHAGRFQQQLPGIDAGSDRLTRRQDS